MTFGLTVNELQPSKVTSASHNQKIVMRDNSKTVALIVLKLSQSSSEPKSTPGTNFRQNLRHEGENFEKKNWYDLSWNAPAATPHQTALSWIDNSWSGTSCRMRLMRGGGWISFGFYWLVGH